MTETLPAVVEHRAEVALPDTDSWIQVVGDVAKLAQHIAGTEFVPRSLRDSVPAVAAAMLYGREVGLPPMTALTQTHVIEGKPAMSAEAMRALVLAAGHEIHVQETTGALCTMRGRRRGSETWTPVTWTIDMARAAGVAGKQVWKSYPRQMLQARCTAELCRLVFPDVIHGFRAVEEFDESQADAPEEPKAPTSTVSRAQRGRPAKKAAPALPAAERPVERPADDAAPPLPGEPGYEDLTSTGDETSGDRGEAGDESKGEGEAPGDSSPNPTDEPVDETPRPPRKASRAQQRGIFAQLGVIGIDDVREERLHITSKIVGREIVSFDRLTTDDASKVIDTLARLEQADDPKAALFALLDEIDAHAQPEYERTDGDAS